MSGSIRDQLARALVAATIILIVLSVAIWDDGDDDPTDDTPDQSPALVLTVLRTSS